MKAAFFTLLLGNLAAASPLGSIKDYARGLERRVGVTEQTLDEFTHYVQHAGAAYCNVKAAPGTLIGCSDNVCNDLSSVAIVQSFYGDKTGISAYVATDHARREIVLSVRGSNNIDNFITDVKFFWNSCSFVKDCKVHKGFDQAWAEIAAGATAAIQAQKKANSGYKIVATGHSLGGAVATLGAVFLRSNGLTVDIYSFGSPRVGNNHFANFVTNSGGVEYRITHSNDPVPRLPPLIFGYRHTSPEYWLSVDSQSNDYPLADIKVCQGIANLGCNGGTLGLDIPAHLQYFIPVSSCEPVTMNAQSMVMTSTKAKVAATSDEMHITADEETLEERINRWAMEDRELAASL